QNDVTLKMPAFEWVHVQLHQQKGMISLSPPTICNSADLLATRFCQFINLMRYILKMCRFTRIADYHFATLFCYIVFVVLIL
ncbi:hypothetical protein Q5544_24325, partial [Escherichia coli]|nr:hypothetical protein [Escherichia coli]MED8642737.1 hypothetical protein [Escherichia coli]